MGLIAPTENIKELTMLKILLITSLLVSFNAHAKGSIVSDPGSYAYDASIIEETQTTNTLLEKQTEYLSEILETQKEILKSLQKKHLNEDDKSNKE